MFLVEFAFDEPAFAAADGDAEREEVTTEEVGSSERGVRGGDAQHRAALAHGERGAEAYTPFVEAEVTSVGEME